MGTNSPKNFLESFVDVLSKIGDILNLRALSRKDRKDLFILIFGFMVIVGFYKLKIITPLEGRIIASFYMILLILRGIQFTIGK